eukprot:Nk52_evm47s32 gene=Nk52_evmTU47s32
MTIGGKRTVDGAGKRKQPGETMPDPQVDSSWRFSGNSLQVLSEGNLKEWEGDPLGLDSLSLASTSRASSRASMGNGNAARRHVVHLSLPGQKEGAGGGLKGVSGTKQKKKTGPVAATSFKVREYTARKGHGRNGASSRSGEGEGEEDGNVKGGQKKYSTAEEIGGEHNKLEYLPYEMPFKVEEFVTKKLPRGKNIIRNAHTRGNTNTAQHSGRGVNDADGTVAASDVVKNVSMSKLKQEVQEKMKQEILDKLKEEDEKMTKKTNEMAQRANLHRELVAVGEESDSSSYDSSSSYWSERGEMEGGGYEGHLDINNLQLATWDPAIMKEEVSSRLAQADEEQEARRKELGEYMGTLHLKMFHENLEDQEPLVEFPSNFSEMCEVMEDYRQMELDDDSQQTSASSSFWAKNICKELGYREQLLSSPSFAEKDEDAVKFDQEMDKIRKFDVLLAQKSKKEKLIKSIRSPRNISVASSRNDNNLEDTSSTVIGDHRLNESKQNSGFNEVHHQQQKPIQNNDCNDKKKKKKKKQKNFILKNKRLAAHAGEYVPMTDDEHFRLQALVGNLGNEDGEESSMVVAKGSKEDILKSQQEANEEKFVRWAVVPSFVEKEFSDRISEIDLKLQQMVPRSEWDSKSISTFALGTKSESHISMNLSTWEEEGEEEGELNENGKTEKGKEVGKGQKKKPKEKFKSAEMSMSADLVSRQRIQEINQQLAQVHSTSTVEAEKKISRSQLDNLLQKCKEEQQQLLQTKEYIDNIPPPPLHTFSDSKEVIGEEIIPPHSYDGDGVHEDSPLVCPPSPSFLTQVQDV